VATSVRARFDDSFGSYEAVILSAVAGDQVGDRILVGQMDLVCSGFRAEP
jgi:hypothetical protein